MWGLLRLSEGHSTPFRCAYWYFSISDRAEPLNSKLANIKEPADETAAADVHAGFVLILSEMQPTVSNWGNLLTKQTKYNMLSRELWWFAVFGQFSCLLLFPAFMLS